MPTISFYTFLLKLEHLSVFHTQHVSQKLYIGLVNIRKFNNQPGTGQAATKNKAVFKSLK